LCRTALSTRLATSARSKGSQLRNPRWLLASVSSASMRRSCCCPSSGTPGSPGAGVIEAGLDPRQRAGRLSGGQQAQLALTLAVAKRPELLILDEPVANLDPLARRQFLDSVADAVGTCGEGITAIFSSHLVADVERTCGYLILLTASRVRLAGPVDSLLAAAPRFRSLDDLVVSYLREVPR